MAQVEIVVEETPASDDNLFVLALLFLPTLLIVYIIPLLGTIYSKTSARKWISYWVAVLLLDNIVKPILNYSIGSSSGTFIFLVLATFLLYSCNNEKSQLLVKAGNSLTEVVGTQYENGKQRLTAVGKKYGLIE